MICRFINPDSEISGVGGEMLGYNMYTYCFNNPVNMSDLDGNWPSLLNLGSGEYYNKPWRITADIYGGVLRWIHTESAINNGFQYLESLKSIKRPNTLHIIGVD